jgi:acyl transferase domain-containing protein/SAM-dependent methyltransferase
VDDLDIAIVGMAGRFPGARTIDEFWRNLRAGVDAVRFLTAEDLARGGMDPSIVRDPSYVPASMILDDADMFDAGFFGYTPREAQTLDPQGRVFLECVWEALEHAGCDPNSYPGTIGVFACQSASTYLLGHLHGQIAFREFILSTTNLQSVIAAGHDFLPTRVSYKLNLTGPSVNVQSACSSSLVAVHLARQSLLTGECDAAIVGGVSIYLPQQAGYHYQEGMILSPDGRCRPFDAEANGTIFGRGVGVVVLKPMAAALRDGDEIYAVLKGSAVNNDGAGKVGYTAPGVDGQARVVAEALANAGVDADTISYIEAHGTGTAQGDPIEVAALSRAFRATTNRTQFCAIGSVKGNVGHLDVAAGVTGLIKTVLMLRHRERLPSLHFTRPNPLIDFANSPFYVNGSLAPWDAEAPRRAGVSSFGMGGTNAHIVLEEAPAIDARRLAGDRSVHVLTLSAKTSKALAESAGRYETWLRGAPDADLAAMCYTTNVGRAHFSHRAGIPVRSREQALNALGAVAAGKSAPLVSTGVAPRTPPNVAFLFTGQGSQYSGMGRALYESEPVFKAALDRCAALCHELDVPLLSVMFDPQHAATLDQTRYTQPALFALEYALVVLWRSWGVTPSLVLGHSLGEDIAACVAGIFSLEDGLRLIVARARLMQALPQTGEMVTLFGRESRIREAVAQHAPVVSIAALNGPDIVLISGERSAVRSIVAELAQEGIKSRPLTASHAFHSALMDPMLDAFEAIARGVNYSAPSIPLLSNVTADIAPPELVCDAAYWRRHVRETVRFAESVMQLRARGAQVVIEIGPTPTLLALAQRATGDDGIAWLPSLRKGRADGEQVMESLGALYAAGVDIKWPDVHRDRGRRRIALPSYPFQRERYWIDRKTDASGASVPRAAARLVGHRITSPVVSDVVYETTVSVDTVPYVGDHVVADAVVFPATGFLELAFEAGASLAPAVRLENVSIEQALLVPPGGVRAQTILATPVGGRSGFKVYACADGESDEVDWTLHAQGEIVAVPGGQEPDTNAMAIVESARARCDRHVSGAEYYNRLRTEGFSYGSSFQGIVDLWWRSGEALARVRMPESVTNVDKYRAHPALFDGGLQLVLAAVGQLECGGSHMYLPVSMGRVDVFVSLTDIAWSHVDARTDGSAGHLATITMLDAAGRLLARIVDVRLVRTARAALRWTAETVDDRLYEIQWEPSRVPPSRAADASPEYLPSTAVLVQRVLPTLDSIRPAIAQYDTLLPELDRLCAEYVCEAFRDLGWKAQAGERVVLEVLAARLGVGERHHRMLARMLEMLVEDGYLSEVGDGWIVERVLVADASSPHALRLERDYPTCLAELKLTKRCGSQLAAVLTGETDPLHLLFPDGSARDLEQLYRDAPFTRAYNTVVRDAVSAALEQLPRDRKVRILEIGAGTGGTSALVLPALPADRTEYFFTDASNVFMVRARESFRAFPFVTYQLLDIEKDPRAQGYREHDFDLVLATNVLHATPDLAETLGFVRDLLASDGLLVMVEGVSRQRWVDIIFGLTEGWWKASDRELRGTYPLISRAKWQGVLGNVGFNEIQSVPAVEQRSICEQAVLMARAPRAARQIDRSTSPDHIVFGDENGLAGILRDRKLSGVCRLIVPGTGFGVRPDGVITVESNSVADFNTALQELLPRGATCRTVVHCLGADRTTDPTDLRDLRARQTQSVGSLLALTQALVDRSAVAPALWIVTRGVPVGATASAADVSTASEATVWGMARSIALEHPELSCTRVDLDPNESLEVTASRLAAELRSSDGEEQIAWRGDMRYVARLTPATFAAAPPEDTDVELQIASRGVLDRLEIRPSVRRPPAPREVAIRVIAAGLNFKDVLNALGAYPGNPGPLGFECAGVVVAVGADVSSVQVGEEVLAIAPGCFATVALAHEALVVRKPAALSMEQAATLPGVFLTAWHSLIDLARVKAGDRVLVHAAAGGVGMAALQLAVRAGAEVFATAGSPDKRRLVRELGAAHVMDSRSLAFADEIQVLTHGRGVDVVLNSLAGEFLDRSVEVTAQGGRFVELGKTGAWNKARVASLGRGIEFHEVDVQASADRDPERIGALLRTIVADVEAGQLRSLPVLTYPFDEAVKAFRFMSQAKHVGKIALMMPRVTPTATIVRPDATYLITGGFGGLGVLLADWMVGRGARHIALFGRRAPNGDRAAAIEALRARGADVRVLVGNVASPDDVRSALDTIRGAMPPLRGVLHAAGTLDDGTISQQRWDRFERVMAAKVDGAWNLDQETRDVQLDWFVLFSSLASMLGSRGQANHSAANAYMDALAAVRQRRGVHGLSINWGAWAQVGAAAEREVLDRLAGMGVGAISPEDGITLFETVLQASMSGRLSSAQVGVLPIAWGTYVKRVCGDRVPRFLSIVAQRARREARPAEQRSPAPHGEQTLVDRLKVARSVERRDLLVAYVREHVVRSLGLDAAQPLDVRQPLGELGLDSLMAIELRSRIASGLGVSRSLPATLLFDYPSVEQIAGYLQRGLVPEDAEVAPTAPADDSRAAAVAAVADLTDEEAEALLLAELSGKRSVN